MDEKGARKPQAMTVENVSVYDSDFYHLLASPLYRLRERTGVELVL